MLPMPSPRKTLAPPRPQVDRNAPDTATSPVPAVGTEAPPPPAAAAADPTAQLDPTRAASITQADGAPPPAPVEATVRPAGWGSLPMDLLRRFLDADVITQAAAVAFYAALSLAPLMLLLLWVTATNASLQDAVLAQVKLLVGPEAESVARTVVKTAQEAGRRNEGWWSIGLLVVGASAVFAQLQDALNRIFRTDATALAGVVEWLRKRIFSFGVLLALGFLLLVSMTVTTVLDLALRGAGVSQPVLATLATLVVYTLAFGFMYHFLPDRRVRWGIAMAGGAFTAVLFVLGRLAIAWYLKTSTTANAYGAMGALVLTMLWVYYAAIILFAGAVVTAIVDERRGPPSARKA